MHFAEAISGALGHASYLRNWIISDFFYSVLWAQLKARGEEEVIVKPVSIS